MTNKHIIIVWDIIKNYWFGFLLLVGMVTLCIKNGLINTFITLFFSWTVLLYFLLKNNLANGLIRYFLKMRTVEDEQKTKKRKNYYGKKAKEESFKVEKFDW